MPEFTWDPEEDTAYLTLQQEIRDGEAVQQIIVDLGEGAEYEIVLDFDGQGRLLGLEIIGAAKCLGADTVEDLLRRLQP